MVYKGPAPQIDSEVVAEHEGVDVQLPEIPQPELLQPELLPQPTDDQEIPAQESQDEKEELPAPDPEPVEPNTTVHASKDEKGDTKRLFGLAHQKTPAYILQDDYGQRYPPDGLGEEMNPNARVWRVYLDEAELNDRDMVEGWKDAMDVLLVFAGLFSAVVTTFVVQTSQKLDVDYGEINASLLTELIALQRAALTGGSASDINPSAMNLESEPQFTDQDIWINGLWFVSLSLSLVVALSGVLIKQWIQHYVSFVSGTPRERARVHHFRYLGIQKWSVPAIIGMLPLLLHAALFLFLAGLVLFLETLVESMAGVVGALGLCAFGLYLSFTLLPLFYPQCPYHTPLIEHGRSVVAFVVFACRRILFPLTHRIIPHLLSHYRKIFHADPIGWLDDWCQDIMERGAPSYALQPLKYFEFNAARQIQDEITSEIIHWLMSASSNPTVKPIALQSIGGVRMGFSQIEHLLGAESPVREELLREVEQMHKVAADVSNNADTKDTFFGSPLFFSFERLLRAMMLVPNHTRKWYNVINLPGLMEPSTLPTESGQGFITYIMDQCWNLYSPNDVMYWLAFAGEVAGHHPMVWRTWANVLRAVPPYNTSFISPGLVVAHNHYYQLLRPLMEGTSSTETWAITLPLVCKVLPLENEQLGDLLEFPNELEIVTKEELFFKKLKFVRLLVNRLVAECNDDARNIATVAPVIVTIVDTCFGLTPQEYTWKHCYHVTAIVARIFEQPFFINDSWDYTTYYKMFDLLIAAQVCCGIANRPTPMVANAVLSRWLEHKTIAHSFFESMRASRSDTNGAHTRHLNEQIRQIFSILESETANRDIYNNILNTFTTATRSSSNLTMGPLEVGRQWITPLQPLVRWMLTQVITSGEQGVMDEGASTFHTVLSDSTQPDWFFFICSPFLVVEESVTNTRKRIKVTFDLQESHILLQLAYYFKDSPNMLDSWRRLLSLVATSSARIRTQDWEKPEWHKSDYEHYLRLVAFFNHLRDILGLSGPEFTMAEIDDTYVPDPEEGPEASGSSWDETLPPQDDGAIDPLMEAESKSRLLRLRRLIPWRPGEQHSANEEEIGLESQSSSVKKG